MIAEEVFVIYYLAYIFNPIIEVKKGNLHLIKLSGPEDGGRNVQGKDEDDKEGED